MSGDLASAIFDRCHPEPNSGCWLWAGHVNSSGYGRVNLKITGFKLAHRCSYEAFNGPIAPGMFICHRCDVRSCVNPDHLFQGTPRDNMDDCVAKGRTVKWAGRRSGEANFNSRLSAQQILEIRKQHAAGQASYRAIGARFGIRRDHVRDIVKGYYWKDLKA